MSLFKRTITLLLIFSLLGADVAPAFAAVGGGSVPAVEKSDEIIPPFPEDGDHEPVDWAAVNWDRKVILPEDEQAYFKQMQELSARGDTHTLSALKKPEEPMYSDRIMSVYQVPLNVQEIVRAYRIALLKGLSSEKAKERKKILKEDLTALLNPKTAAETPSDPAVVTSEIQLPEVPLIASEDANYPQIDLSGTEPLSSPIEIVSENLGRDSEITVKTVISPQAAKNSLEAVTTKILQQKHLEKPARVSGLFLFDQQPSATRISEILWNILGVERASAGTPLISAYDGIEKNPLDYDLLYLSSQQEQDGGLSGPDRYMATAQAALLLSEARLTNNDQYQAMIDYLKTATVETVREKAMKARIFLSLKESGFETILADILKYQQSDGGFGLTEFHQSDVLTTLEVAWTMWATEYYKKDSQPLAKALLYAALAVDQNGAVRYSADGPASPYLAAKMLHYFVLFQTFKISAVTGQGEHIDISMKEKIQAMLSYLGTGIDPVTGTLSGTREVSDLAQALYAFQLYHFEPELQKKMEERLLASQRSNGSFDDSIHATVSAFLALAKPDLVIESITRANSLIVGQDAFLNITIRNRGYVRGTPKNISLFVDNVLLYGSSSAISISRPLSPGESVLMGDSIPMTMAFTGESKFEYFVEAAEPEVRSSNNWKAETYQVTDPEERPALLRYFVSQKAEFGHDDDPKSPAYLIPEGVTIPAFFVSYRKKVDPKRKFFVVLHRPKGVTEVGREWDGTPIPWYQTIAPENMNGFFLAKYEEPYLAEGSEFEIKIGVADKNNRVHIPQETITIQLTSDANKHRGTVSGSLTLASDPAPDVSLRGNGIYQKTDEKGNFSVSLGNGIGAVWADRLTSPWLDELVTVFPVPNGGEEKNVRVFTKVKTDTTPPTLEKPFLMPQWRDTEIKSDRVVTLVARASDAVYVKSATFWHWDPVIKEWQFVVSKDAPYNRDGIPIDIIHKWYIPPEMIGTGYKIKAVVEDYSGNVSQIVESDTFEILDGVPPKDVTPPTIQALELRYMQGATIKNQQNAVLLASANDNVSVTKGDFSYWDPKTNQWVAIGTSSGQQGMQSIEWPISKELLGAGYKIKAIVYDDAGNASVAKEFGPFEIISGSKPWGIVTVNGLTNGEWILGEKKTITWDLKGANPIKTIDAVRIYYNGPDWSGWHIKSSLDPNQVKSLDYTLGMQASLEGRAKIQLYVCDTVWNCATIDSPEFIIVDPSPPRQYPWNKEQVFDLTRTKYPLYRMLNETFHNGDGSREYVYTEYDTVKDDATNNSVQYVRIMYRKLANGSWQDPIPLVQDLYREGIDERITINDVHAIKGPREEIHVDFLRTHGKTWQQEGDNYEMYYLRFESGSVQERVQVSSDDTMSRYPRMAVDSRGNVIVAWVEGWSFTRNGGLNVLKVRTNKNGAWSSTTNLTNTVWTDSSVVTMDRDQPVILYNQDGDYLIRRLDAAWSGWSNPIAITPRTIAKTAFEKILDSPEKLQTLVGEDPSDPSLYRWKPSILIRRDLFAATNGFQSQKEILDIWYDNQYAVSAYNHNLFTSSPGVYDLFSHKGGAQQQWHYTIRFLRVKPNFDTGDPGIQTEREIIGNDRITTDVRSYRVLQDRDGLYNVFYIKKVPIPTGEITHPYHFYFDGLKIWHHAMAASPLRYVSDYITAVSERNDVISYHFADGSCVNTADYSAIKNYQLSLTSPAYDQKLSEANVKLAWSLTGGSVDSYTVLAGTNSEALKTVADNVTSGTEVNLTGLEGDITYSWQVLGKKSGKVISSAIWQFITPPANAKIDMSDENGPLDLTAPLSFPTLTVGASSERTLLIRNLGNAPLTFAGDTAARLDGADANQFAITKQPDSSIDAGKATTAVIAFKPSSSGAKNAELIFVTNESGGKEIRLKLSSSAIASAMTLTVDGKTVTVNGTHDLGSIAVGAVVDVPVVIRNTGDADLVLLKPLGGDNLSYIQFFGTGAGSARVLSDPVSPIVPGESASFVVRVQPKKAGESIFGIRFYHNDKKIVNPAPINFTAVAVKPNVTVSTEAQVDPVKNGDSVDIGSVPAGTMAKISFDIKNTGTAPLIIAADPVLTVLNGDANDFEFERVLANRTIQPGLQEQIVLKAKPKRKGVKRAQITFSTNDIDVPVMSIVVVTSVSEADLDILASGSSLKSAGTTWKSVALDPIALGKSGDIALSISNIGGATLRVDQNILIIQPEDDQTISILKVPDQVVEAGSSTTLILRVTPKTSGKKDVLISIATNDPDADRVTVPITYTATEPEVGFWFGGKEVSTAIPLNVIDFGDLPMSTASAMTVIVKNTGDADLLFKQNGVVLAGDDTGDFTLTSSSLDPIKPGEERAIIVNVAPSSFAPHEATLVVKTNDRDEPDVRITLRSVGIAPILTVTSQQKELKRNEIIAMRDTLVGESVEQSFTIANTGTNDLSLTGVGQLITLSGAAAAEFSIDQPSATSLKPGEKTNFTIRFTPRSSGEKKSAIAISSTDVWDKTITFNLLATARDPEIDLFYDDASVPSGGTVILGETGVGVPLERTFTIKNSGNTPLRFEDQFPFVQLDGADASFFAVSSTLATNVLDPGKTATVTVRFVRSTRGDASATLIFRSNDRDESVSMLQLSASAHDPQIGVTKDGIALTSNASVELGSAAVTSRNDYRFMIANNGDRNLSLKGSAPYTVLSGENASQFILDSQLPLILKPGEAAPITISFAPTSEGAKRAKIVIESSDRTNPQFTIPLSASAFVPVGLGTGLTAEYFADPNLSGLVSRTTDPQINFDWQLDPPNTDMPKNDFSVRWSGTVEAPMSGEYEVVSRADDGVRVWVNGVQLIDDWAERGVKENSGKITLARGQKYDIVFEYFDGINTALARLSWRRPDGVTEIIPASQLYPKGVPDIVPRERGTGTGLTAEYFADTSGTALIMRRTDPMVNFQWKEASPHADVPTDGFSVRWYGYVEPRYSGDYTIVTKTDDGVRVWIDGKKVIDDWNSRATKENSATVTMQAGEKHRITMMYYENTGLARAHLYWITPHGMREAIPQSQLYPMNVPDIAMPPAGTGTGLSAEYFTGVFAQSVLTRIDPQIDFRWNYDAPDSRLPANNFSARWTGKIETRSPGVYEFAAKSDDGIRVTINGKTVIDNWSSAGLRTSNGAITLERGKKYDMRVEYYDDTGYATSRLYWKTPYGKTEIVPVVQLYTQ